MKAFWISFLVLILLAGGIFITGEIIATNKGYKNVVEWVKEWDVGKKKETKDVVVENEDSTARISIEL